MESSEKHTCQNCGSSRIEQGIAISQSAETGNIGPKYKANLLMTGVSQMYCDMCLDCGEIIRLYIKDKTDRNWIKKSGVIGSK